MHNIFGLIAGLDRSDLSLMAAILIAVRSGDTKRIERLIEFGVTEGVGEQFHDDARISHACLLRDRVISAT